MQISKGASQLPGNTWSLYFRLKYRIALVLCVAMIAGCKAPKEPSSNFSSSQSSNVLPVVRFRALITTCSQNEVKDAEQAELAPETGLPTNNLHRSEMFPNGLPEGCVYLILKCRMGARTNYSLKEGEDYFLDHGRNAEKPTAYVNWNGDFRESDWMKASDAPTELLNWGEKVFMYVVQKDRLSDCVFHICGQRFKIADDLEDLTKTIRRLEERRRQEEQ